jgi:hypothetical protein
MLIIENMNSCGHLTVSESAARRVRKNKAQARRGRPKKSANGNGNGNGHANGVPHLAAAGSLTRTKALLLAALRVWELKHRIGE